MFRLFRYTSETPKQTETKLSMVSKMNRNKHETDLVSVIFGLNRNFFYSFRGHPSYRYLPNPFEETTIIKLPLCPGAGYPLRYGGWIRCTGRGRCSPASGRGILAGRSPWEESRPEDVLPLAGATYLPVDLLYKSGVPYRKIPPPPYPH